MVNRFGYFINLLVGFVIILGFYNIYFFTQKKTSLKNEKFSNILTFIDNYIPFKPQWIWVYSGLYYPAIFYLVFTIDNFKQFIYTIFNFLILLFIQLTFFYLFPIKTPSKWRDYNRNESLSTKMLSYVQTFDDRGNCFPSMHVSVASLVAFHLINNSQHSLNNVVYLYFLFPILIAISTLFTKQHYLIDTLAGFLLGWFCFKLFDSTY